MSGDRKVVMRPAVPVPLGTWKTRRCYAKKKRASKISNRYFSVQKHLLRFEMIPGDNVIEQGWMLLLSTAIRSSSTLLPLPKLKAWACRDVVPYSDSDSAIVAHYAVQVQKSSNRNIHAWLCEITCKQAGIHLEELSNQKLQRCTCFANRITRWILPKQHESMFMWTCEGGDVVIKDW